VRSRASPSPERSASAAWRRSPSESWAQLIGGVIGEVVLGHEVRFKWDLGPFLLAVAGSVVLLLALEALRGRWR
jgi:hypothetical protein